MTKKQFTTIRLIIVALLSISIGISVSLNITFIPPIAIIVSAVIIRLLYSKVNEVTADERDYKLAGKAARTTLAVVSITLATIGASLLAYSTTNPDFYRPGYLILYIVSFIMIVNIIAYLYHQKHGK